ncbi:MAG: hypothetical protein K6L80_15370 [Agarilytica sp.]
MVEKIVTGFFFVASLFLFVAHVEAAPQDAIDTVQASAESVYVLKNAE